MSSRCILLSLCLASALATAARAGDLALSAHLHLSADPLSTRFDVHAPAPTISGDYAVSCTPSAGASVSWDALAINYLQLNGSVLEAVTGLTGTLDATAATTTLAGTLTVQGASLAGARVASKFHAVCASTSTSVDDTDWGSTVVPPQVLVSQVTAGAGSSTVIFDGQTTQAITVPLATPIHTSVILRANPHLNQYVLVHLRGPGVQRDLRIDDSTQTLDPNDLTVTFSESGTFQLWATFMPYGADSNVVTYTVGTGVPDAGTGTDPLPTASGCSSLPLSNALPLWLVVCAFGARRRRAA